MQSNTPASFDKKYVPRVCSTCKAKTQELLYYEPYIKSGKRIDRRNTLVLRFCSIAHLREYLQEAL